MNGATGRDTAADRDAEVHGGPGPTGPGSPASPAAEPGGQPDVEQDVEDGTAEAELLIEHDIASLLTERDQFKEIALRLQADFENYRKRADRQVSDGVEHATARLVEALLPVLDACEAAFSHGAEDVEPIWSALLGTLQRQGLEVMDPMDKPFDPTEQEAVAHEPGEPDEAFGEPVVAEVFRTGYRWKGKTLRAAMVKVKG